LEQLVVVQEDGGERVDRDDHECDEYLDPVEREYPLQHRQHAGAGIALEEVGAVGERNRNSRQEYKSLGRIGKAEILVRHMREYVVRDVIDKDREQRDAAPEVDPVNSRTRAHSRTPLWPRVTAFLRITGSRVLNASWAFELRANGLAGWR